MHRSGSFKNGIRELASKAGRAFFGLKSILRDMSPGPKMFLRLFDSFVLPILLYCCEIWGGFGWKKHPDERISLLNQLLLTDSTEYEKLNIKLCKQILRLPSRASNIACRAELGRYPLMINIIVAMLKYDRRLRSLGPNDLVSHAYMSQKSRVVNSYHSLTHPTLCDKLNGEIATNTLDPVSVA